MTPRKFLVTLSLILGLLLLPQPGIAGHCEFGDLALFATNSIRIGTNSAVTGNVVANEDSPGPVLDEGVELALDRNASITGDASAFAIDVDNGASISGTQTVLTSPAFGPDDIPAFLEADVRADAQDVTVLPGVTILGASSLSCSVSGNSCTVDGDCPVGEACVPGRTTNFGDITILQGGILLFTEGGRFDVRSITAVSPAGPCDGSTATPCSSIEFDAATELRVEGRMDPERGAYFGPAAAATIDASDIRVYVGGQNGATGGLFETPRALNFGRQSEAHGNFYVPRGTFELEKESEVTGAILAADIQIDKDSTISRDSAFVNRAPTAFPQEVLTDGSNALVIILEGSDPEGDDLSFVEPVPVLPTEGTLSAITPITPPTVQLCSQSGVSCTIDNDCPGFAEGETCDTVQPPITQASVTYTPTNCTTVFSCSASPETSCTVDTDCPSGQTCVQGGTQCAEDFFTFAVQDDCGDQGSAIVNINGATDPGDPNEDPLGTTVVDARDLEIDAVVNQSRTITLSAAAPDGVAALTFRIETLPSGTLEDSNGTTIASAPTDLPSPVVTYTAPATTGSDPFTYSARDSTTSTPPCGSPSCDTATVNIDVGNLPRLAPDQSVGTDLNQPLQITLRANSGGAPGGGQGPQSAGAPIELAYGDNGPPLTQRQLERLARRSGGPVRGGRMDMGAPQQLSPTALGVGSGWFQFGWCDEASLAQGETCANRVTLTNLLNPIEVIESPFTFTTNQPACLRVTDTLAKGDHWRVEAQVNGNPDWTDFTREVPQSQTSTTSNPDVAFDDPSYSSGEFDLVSGGSYSVRLITIPPDSFSWGTAGYVRVDNGSCADIVWEVTSLPVTGTAPGTLTNLDGSTVSIGAKYFSQPTMVYTPNFNVSGTTSFGYKVTEGGLIGTGVIDTALVDITVSINDPCALVGRPPGCSPGGGGQAPEGQGGVQAELEREVKAGPNRGLTIVIEGVGGSVSSSPVAMSGDRMLMGLACSGGDCNKLLPEGAEVLLFARPDGEHFEFLGWGGDCWGSEPILAITLSEHTRCTATFGERPQD